MAVYDKEAYKEKIAPLVNQILEICKEEKIPVLSLLVFPNEDGVSIASERSDDVNMGSAMAAVMEYALGGERPRPAGGLKALSALAALSSLANMMGGSVEVSNLEEPEKNKETENIPLDEIPEVIDLSKRKK